MPYKPTGRPSGRPKKAPQEMGEAPKLTKKQWKGIEYQIEHPNASQAEIGRAVGVRRQSVSQWQKNKNYMRGLYRAHGIRLAEHFEKKDAERKKKIRDEAKKRIVAPDTAYEFLRWELANKWPGYVVSPLDGRTYRDRDTFLEHIKNWRSADGETAIWAGYLDKPVKK